MKHHNFYILNEVKGIGLYFERFRINIIRMYILKISCATTKENARTIKIRR